jgi:hypothetical protein
VPSFYESTRALGIPFFFFFFFFSTGILLDVNVFAVKNDAES